MRIKSLVLCSASFAALSLAAPAAAQQQDAPVDPTVEAQTQPAADAGSPQTDDGVAEEADTIVVTGLRRSLQSAQSIKRNSDQIVDVVVAEDIGKLPDRAVSEALARVPGIVVERAQGDAGDVFLRGLRDPATTYNGREIFTAEARNVSTGDFPAGGVAALEVFKSLTAEQVEGNLAGSVNVRSRRPFDFSGDQVGGSFNLTYADRAKSYNWNGNLLLSKRLDTEIGDFGVLVNISNTELNYSDAARYVSGRFIGFNPDPAVAGTFRDNFGNNIPGTTLRIPEGVGIFNSAGKRQRPSLNGAIQWRPSANLQFYADYLYQGFRRQVSDRNFFVPTFGGDAVISNVQLRPSAGNFRYPISFTEVNQVRPEGFQAATRERTNTSQIGGGAIYDSSRLRVSADIARTVSKFDLSIYSVDYALTSSPPLQVTFDTDRGEGGVDFNLGALALENPASYRYRGFFDRHLVAKGDDMQARIDATLKDVAPMITGFDFGARYTDRDAGFGNGQRYSYQEFLGLQLNQLPLSFSTFDIPFRDNVTRYTSFLLPTYGSIRNSVTQLRQLAATTNPGEFGAPGSPAFNPTETYTANEKALTGYAQARYSFDGAVPIDGVVGVRVVRTKSDLDGSVRNDNTGVISPLSVKQTYTDYLPNVSLRARLTSQLQVRLAYTETRRRPDFGQLNPGVTVFPAGSGSFLSGRGGNPFLKPITSRNYDLSAEYYFSRTGFAAVALFQRDVKDYIFDFRANRTVPGIGVVQVDSPVNAGKGRLRGVEAQVRSFFDFNGLPEWATGFGAEANLTYISDRLAPPPSFPATAGNIAFPDVSKWAYNLVGFYEKGPLTARVAYNYRSRFRQGYELGFNNQVVGEFSRGTSRLDASVGYALNEHLTLAADVSNILGKPFRNYRIEESGVVYPRDVRFEERVYSVGVRFRY